MARKLISAQTRNAYAWRVLCVNEELEAITSSPVQGKSEQMEEQALLKQRDKLFDKLGPWLDRTYPERIR